MRDASALAISGGTPPRGSGSPARRRAQTCLPRTSSRAAARPWPRSLSHVTFMLGVDSSTSPEVLVERLGHSSTHNAADLRTPRRGGRRRGLTGAVSRTGPGRENGYSLLRAGMGSNSDAHRTTRLTVTVRQPAVAPPAGQVALRHREGALSSGRAADRRRCHSEAQALQAGHAGSTPVTRSPYGRRRRGSGRHRVCRDPSFEHGSRLTHGDLGHAPPGLDRGAADVRRQHDPLLERQ